MEPNNKDPNLAEPAKRACKKNNLSRQNTTYCVVSDIIALYVVGQSSRKIFSWKINRKIVSLGEKTKKGE